MFQITRIAWFCFYFIIGWQRHQISWLFFKRAFSCLNNECHLKNTNKNPLFIFPTKRTHISRNSTAMWLGQNLIRLIVWHCTLSVSKYGHLKKYTQCMLVAYVNKKSWQVSIFFLIIPNDRFVFFTLFLRIRKFLLLSIQLITCSILDVIWS